MPPGAHNILDASIRSHIRQPLLVLDRIPLPLSSDGEDDARVTAQYLQQHRSKSDTDDEDFTDYNEDDSIDDADIPSIKSEESLESNASIEHVVAKRPPPPFCPRRPLRQRCSTSRSSPSLSEDSDASEELPPTPKPTKRRNKDERDRKALKKDKRNRRERKLRLKKKRADAQVFISPGRHSPGFTAVHSLGKTVLLL